MAGTVSQHQQGTLTNPSNGDNLDATVVLGGINAVGTTHNGHDSDATIHVQSSTLAGRPAAGTAQRVWITTDGLRAYVDNGSAWQELAYLSLAAGGTVAGATAFSSTVAVTGAVTASSTYAGAGQISVSGNLSVSLGSNGYVAVGSSTANGAQILGQGSSKDIGLYNKVGGVILDVLTGTLNVQMYGSLAITGSLSGVTTLATTSNATVGGTLAVTGATTLAAVSATTGTFSSTLGVTGVATLTGGAVMGANVNLSTASGGAFFLSDSAAPSVGLVINGATKQVNINDVNWFFAHSGLKVVGPRKTGWTIMTGTPVRATKATSTVTLAELAGIVMAMQQDLGATSGHGLIDA